jgi:hypothetical protein
MAVAMIALMMEAARTSKTLINFYQTTRRYNPEDSHLRTHRRENLKSYFDINYILYWRILRKTAAPFQFSRASDNFNGRFT